MDPFKNHQKTTKLYEPLEGLPSCLLWGRVQGGQVINSPLFPASLIFFIFNFIIFIMLFFFLLLFFLLLLHLLLLIFLVLLVLLLFFWFF